MPLSSNRHIADDQFRKKLQNYRVQPSAKVWNRLSEALNLQQLKQGNSRRFILVLALVLLSSGGIWINNNFQPTRNANIALMQVPEVDNESLNNKAYKEIISPAQPLQQAPVKSRKEYTPVTLNGQSETSAIESTIFNGSIFVDDGMPAGDFTVERTTKVPYSWTLAADDITSLPQSTGFSVSQHEEMVYMQVIESKSSSVISRNPKYYMANVAGFYVGFGENFNSTHIIDKKAFHDENLKYSPTFGTALMVHGGYNLNNKWGVEAAWVIHSQEGQRYKYLPTDNRTTSLEYNQKHVSFNYMQFPVMARYKVQGWSGITETPIFVNYSLGFQYGRLLSYSVDETKEQVSNQNIFRKDEYALVAGLDYDFLSRKTAFYTLGIRASYGSNLFVKNVPEYLEFQRPHNLLIGVHGAVNFSLGKAQQKPAL